MTNLFRRSYRLLTLVLDILFPRLCITCGIQGYDLCGSCIHACHWPKPKRRNHQWMIALWNYRDHRVKTVITTLKNKPNYRLALVCTAQFVQQLAVAPRSPDLWILVPIPITMERFRERGYNQSELIARAYQRALAHRFGILIPIKTNVLVKQRTTQKQGTTASREERMGNMKNVFKVIDKKQISDKHIIIIDDVTTTGATLYDARRALEAAGAAQVLAWTIAN